MPPSFTAIALDRLIDRGASSETHNSKLEKKRNTSTTTTTTTTTTKKKKIHWPLLYATPEATPLPDSPSSFPPSPYIINHKRRGPRLLKSVSHDDISLQQQQTTTITTTTEEDDQRNNQVDKNGRNEEIVVVDSTNISVNQTANEDEKKIEEDGRKGEIVVVDSIGEEFSFTAQDISEVGTKGIHDQNLGSNSLDNGLGKAENLSQLVAIKSERDTEIEDFFDPQDTMSATSNTEVEDNSGAERSLKMSTPIGEYFDAYEELSSEGGPSSSLRDMEAELREIRLNLLMEIERRKQGEEALNSMQTQWQRLRQQLSLVGLTLPAAPTISAEDENGNFDPADDLCQQIHIAGVVSNSVGRGFARAEVEMEMESRIESKNFEITRLCDRLHYYETVNREMSQRNQEAIEMARCDRQRRKRRQRWVWSSIGAAITLGTVALAWSYLPTASGSSSAFPSDAPEVDDVVKP